MKKIGIVTVNFNGNEDTLELLKSASILDTKGLEIRFFVVDNGSKNPLTKKIEEEFKNVELLQTGINKGFTGGYNFGMRYAYNWGADYILIINNDVLFGDKFLIKRLLAVLLKNKKSIVSPKVYFAPGFEYQKQRYKPTDQGKVLWYAGGSFDWKNIETNHRGLDEVDQSEYDTIEQTNTLCGCCLFFGREVIEEVGYFDENYFAYFEDNDLLVRLIRAGFRSFYNGKTFIYHKVSRTAGIGSPITDYFLVRNKLYFGMKYSSLRTKFSLLTWAVRHLLYGRPLQRKGVIDFLFGKMDAPKWMKIKETTTDFPLLLSIVIVNYKTSLLTLRLLETIYDKKSGFNQDNSEVVVLDNASNDGLGKEISKKFPQVKFIQNKKNTGFARGYNRAINYTKGKYVLLLNSDVEVLPNSLKILSEEAEKHNGRAVLAGKLILPNGEVQKSCFKLPTITGAIKEYFLDKKHEYCFFAPQGNKATKVEGAVMACFLIPRRVLNKVGLIPEKNFIYFEDVEYCRRLKNQGVPIYYLPKACFRHHHGASSKKIGKQKAERFLKESAMNYHGRIKYFFLTLILWLGQKRRKQTAEK